MDDQRKYEVLKAKIDGGAYFSTFRNNRLVAIFLDAKFNGGYRRLVFRKRMTNLKTAFRR